MELGCRLLCTAASFVISLASLAAVPEQLEFARRAGPLLARRAPPMTIGPGLLIADFRAKDTLWQAGSDYAIELSPATGGAGRRFAMKVGEAGVLTLDAGRYCLTAVERDGKRHESPCEAPFYDVSGDSLDFTFAVEFELRRKRASVTARTLDDTYADMPLTASQRSDIAAYLDAARSRGARTFLISAPPGLRTTIRFGADGTAELQEYTLANASYLRGRWSEEEGAFVAVFHNGNSRYRFVTDGDGWRGAITDTTTDMGGVDTFRAIRHLAVSTQPECWPWSRCGTRWPSGILFNPDYTFVKNAASLAGKVEFEFSLAAIPGAAKPTQVDIVNSTLSSGQAEDVKENFSGTLFSPDLATDPATRYRQQIAFAVEQGELHARMGELVAVPGSR